MQTMSTTFPSPNVPLQTLSAEFCQFAIFQNGSNMLTSDGLRTIPVPLAIWKWPLNVYRVVVQAASSMRWLRWLRSRSLTLSLLCQSPRIIIAIELRLLSGMISSHLAEDPKCWRYDLVQTASKIVVMDVTCSGSREDRSIAQ